MCFGGGGGFLEVWVIGWDWSRNNFCALGGFLNECGGVATDYIGLFFIQNTTSVTSEREWRNE